jgi:RNA polymerase sigma-70 factor (ECF subfamily)
MTPSPLPSDAELVSRLRARDEAAFVLVVDAWSPGMTRLARSFVSTAATADEVVQDTWLAVLTSLGSFEGRAALRTWVYRILVNTAIRRSRSEARTVTWSSWEPRPGEVDRPSVDPARFMDPGEAFPGHWRTLPPAWPTPEGAALEEEVRAVLRSALDDLPDRQRIVITLRDVEGYSAEEVCTILTISAANQRVLLHRARAVVRARLESYFVSAPKEEARREL